MNGWKTNQAPQAKEYGANIYFLDHKESTGPATAEEIKIFLIEHFEAASSVDMFWGREALSLGEFMVWLNETRAFISTPEN